MRFPKLFRGGRVPLGTRLTPPDVVYASEGYVPVSNMDGVHTLEFHNTPAEAVEFTPSGTSKRLFVYRFERVITATPRVTTEVSE